jgi:TPR repeat protein
MDSISQSWALAIASLKKGEPASAFFALSRLAAEGDSSAYAPLGYLIEMGGTSIPGQAGKAHYWYRRAIAEIDDEIAHAGLGRLYFNGSMGDRDFNKAFFHCTRAPNDPHCWILLGAMYHRGNGVGMDLTKARQYYQRAIQLGYVLPLQYLGRLEVENGNLIKGLLMRLRSVLLAGIIGYRNPNDERLQGIYASKVR